MQKLLIYLAILLPCAYYDFHMAFMTNETFWEARQGGFAALWWCICPWVSLYVSFQGWTITRIWRRMKAQRYQMPSLSRNHYQAIPPKERTSFLEYICLSFITLSLLAIYEQWMAPNLWWRVLA